jgi:hypothetical protein
MIPKLRASSILEALVGVGFGLPIEPSSPFARVPVPPSF